MKWLSDLTSQQWWANCRHYITFGAGILAGIGVITATQQQGLIAGLNDIVGGLERTVAGVVAVAAILGPVINGLISSRRASPASQIQSVQAIAAEPASARSIPNEAKTALVLATNSLPEVKGVITNPTGAGAALAESIPSNTVVPAGTPDATKVAKA